MVGKTPPGASYLGAKTVNTGDTCNTFFYEVVADARGPRIRMDCTPETGRVLAETSQPYLRASCEGAAEAAGVKLSKIDFFVFNTPTAWYGEFCRRALGVPEERSVDTYPEYANVGPALLPVNLYRAAASRGSSQATSSCSTRSAACRARGARHALGRRGARRARRGRGKGPVGPPKWPRARRAAARSTGLVEVVAARGVHTSREPSIACAVSAMIGPWKPRARSVRAAS